MQFTDKVPLTGTRRTNDGYLTADVKVARTGVQAYMGSELGKPELKVVNVYRGEDAVFDKSSMSSFVGKPVTLGHPKEVVTSDNWKDYAVGTIGQDIARDGESIRLSLALMDAKAIKKVEDGSRELSVGYRAELVWGDGVAPDGTEFQAQQTNIFVDHLAVVDVARAGKEFRIGDSAEAWGAAPITQTPHKETVSMTDALRTVVVDGLSVTTTDQGAQAIDKLQGIIRDAATSSAKLVADHTAVVTAKDAEIGTLKAELATVKDAAPKPGDLDRLVRDRATLVATATKVDPKIVTDGKSEGDIKRAVVAAKFGDEFIKDASDAEIGGMFKTIARDAKPRDRIGDDLLVSLNDAGDFATIRDKAYEDSVNEAQNAWKGEAK